MFERIAFTTVDESLSIRWILGVLRFLRLEGRVAEENNGLIAG